MILREDWSHETNPEKDSAILMQVLHTEMSDLGSLRTAPYLVMFASSNFGGWLGDALITRQQYSVVAARRTVNSIGYPPPPPCARSSADLSGSGRCPHGIAILSVSAHPYNPRLQTFGGKGVDADDARVLFFVVQACPV